MSKWNAIDGLVLQDYSRKAIDIITKEIEKDAVGLVFLFGPSGIGKTQLLRIILSKMNVETKIIFEEMESMDNKLLLALEQNDLERVTDVYRNRDLLILENFDTNCWGNVIGNYIADIFEYYIDNKKNIILTSSFTPDVDVFQSQRLKDILSQFMFIDLSENR